MKEKIEMFLLGHKAALAHIPGSTSSDEWGNLQRSFARACGSKDPSQEFVTCITLWPDQCREGVYYSWGLANSDGAWYEVYRMPHQSTEEVKACRNSIRRSQDVVSMTTHRIAEWLPMGKAGLGGHQRDPKEVLQLPANQG